MSHKQGRRDFLKLLGLLPPSLFLPRLFPASQIAAAPNSRNVLIIIFDALSATNVSLYGYPRRTMPNLERIAQRATVYHRHYAAGNFTTPGTASLLTSTYPWTHRAIALGYGVAGAVKHRTLFSTFPDYYRIVYSHNTFVNTLFHEFSSDIDFLEPQKSLFLQNPLAADRLFTNDDDIASVAWERAAKRQDDGYSYSLLFSTLYDAVSRARLRKLAPRFPRGIPRISKDEVFLLDHAVDWVMDQVPKSPRPFLGYFHFLPPHVPYCASREFTGAFDDSSLPAYDRKPNSLFNHNMLRLKQQSSERRQYDEYVLYADAQLGRLYDAWQTSGILEDTYVVFTSDHGEMFERGFVGHHTPVLYQPVIQVPLLILEPGQKTRRDVFSSTSAVDVLPTLLKLTGHPIPDGLAGTVLPPFAEAQPDPERSLFAVEAKLSTDAYHRPLDPVSVMMVKDKYKLVRYAGYKELKAGEALYELYDMQNDSEELNDLYASQPGLAAELTHELVEALQRGDRPQPD